MTKANDLLTELRADVEKLGHKDTAELDRLRRRAEMLIRNTLGKESSYLEDLKHISFHPSVWVSGMDTRPAWDRGRAAFVNLIDTVLDELVLFTEEPDEPSPEIIAQRVEAVAQSSVFIVHGHDEEMKQAVASTLRRVDVEPVILHEQPSKGRTIIEKLMDVAGAASFAIVLLSPDDEARPRADEDAELRPRARQNVIFELGFFLGLLGRSKVVALHRLADGFEIPSDYQGVLFIPYDRRGSWALEMAKEIKAAGLDIDLNRLT